MFRLLTIATDDLIAYEAQISKKLMIMRFAIGQSAFFIMSMAQKWFFTLGAHKMLDVPVFSECSNNTLFDRTTTSAADGNAHFIMATQTVQFIHVIGCKAWTTLHFTSRRIQFTIARCAIEMVAVVDFTTETKWRAIDNTAAREIRNKNNFHYLLILRQKIQLIAKSTTHWHLWQMYFPSSPAFSLALQSWHKARFWENKENKCIVLKIKNSKNIGNGNKKKI